jgi:hypothetical protein
MLQQLHLNSTCFSRKKKTPGSCLPGIFIEAIS